MGIRERMLPPGWYPSSASGCRTEIEQFVAGVAPLPAGVAGLGRHCAPRRLVFFRQSRGPGVLP